MIKILKTDAKQAAYHPQTISDSDNKSEMVCVMICGLLCCALTHINLSLKNRNGDHPILENRSTALVKLSMVLSASPCSIPSRTQCLMWPSSTTLPQP